MFPFSYYNDRLVYESAVVLNAINHNRFTDSDNMQRKGHICNTSNNKDKF